MTRPVLIGTGFYATTWTVEERLHFYNTVWEPNTQKVSRNIVMVDNSQCAVHWSDIRAVTTRDNLGHSGNSSIQGNRLMGWSMSWIIPALIAYSEDCDFVYKEQDCLAFGDWLTEIRQGDICYGTNSRMPCEQSLFYIRRDAIPDFVSAYCAIPDQDNKIVPEDKMVMAAQSSRPYSPRFDFRQTAMPFGRERPLKIYTDRPWYAQKITPEELEGIRKAGLV